jgi:hypothetical protein
MKRQPVENNNDGLIRLVPSCQIIRDDSVDSKNVDSKNVDSKNVKVDDVEVDDVKNNFTEREFTVGHKGYMLKVRVWNEHGVDPVVLYDYNNVLNAYSLESLQKAARTKQEPYAIVSLLMTQGANFHGLRNRAKETGETIVAVTAKIKGDRKSVETGLKYQVMLKMHWTRVKCALDDKPHEWYSTDEQKKPPKLPLDPRKKPVYRIDF